MEIKICGNCNGEGEVRNNGYRGDWDYVECGNCDGTGKVLFREYVIEAPFTTDRTDWCQLADSITHLIREFKDKELVKND